MSDLKAKEGRAGPGRRASAVRARTDKPDRLDATELDARDAAKGKKRRPAGPPLEEEPQDTATPPVPPTKVDEA